LDVHFRKQKLKIDSDPAHLGIVDMAELAAAADIAEAALPVIFRELLEDEFDISPPCKKKYYS
jgi:hypothetical protein